MALDLRPLRAYLHGGDSVGSLLEQAKRNDRSLDLVRSALPAELAAHCTGAVFLGRVLTLTTPSSAWASRLRYAAPQLTAVLAGTDRVQVRVTPLSPESIPNRTPKRKPKPMNPETREVLKSAASAVSDPDLRDALLRLAAHAGGVSDR